MLSPEQVKMYLSLIGPDGWCINYDRETRECGIYQDRPSFCRVRADVFAEMFGIAPEELNDFAIDCCREHIADLYGQESIEMRRFNREITRAGEPNPLERETL